MSTTITATQGADMNELGPIGAVIATIASLTGLWRWIAAKLKTEQDKLTALEAEQQAQLNQLRQDVRSLQESNATMSAKLATAEAHLEGARFELSNAREEIALLRESNRLLERVLSRRERQVVELGGHISDTED